MSQSSDPLTGQPGIDLRLLWHRATSRDAWLVELQVYQNGKLVGRGRTELADDGDGPCFLRTTATGAPVPFYAVAWFIDHAGHPPAHALSLLERDRRARPGGAVSPGHPTRSSRSGTRSGLLGGVR
jgi:hypothetical protein